MGLRAIEDNLTSETKYLFSEPPQRGSKSVEDTCEPREYHAAADGRFDGLMFAFCLFVVLFFLALIRALLA